MLSRIILYIGLFAIAYGASIPSQLDHISLDTDLIARATSELPPPGPNFEIPLLVFFFAKKSDLIGGVVDNSWFHDISSYPEFADRTTDKLTDEDKRSVVMDSKKTERLGVEVEDEVGRMRFTRTTAWQRHFVWQQKSEDSKVLIHDCHLNVTASPTGDPHIEQIYFDIATMRFSGTDRIGGEAEPWDKLLVLKCEQVKG